MHATREERSPSALAGAGVGVLGTAALTGLLYAGWKLAALPFVPSTIFDALTRRLPGALLTGGIETMVSIIRAAGIENTDTAAKLAEQSLAVALFVGAGALAGSAWFAVRRAAPRFAVLLGAALGVALAIPAWIASRDAAASANNAVAGGAWIFGSFASWGAVLGWSWRRLAPARAASRPRDEEAVTAERVDRRRFLVRFGGAAALVTVAGATVGALAGGRRGSTRAERWSERHRLPNTDARVRPVRGTRPELTPLEDHYRIDITTAPPVIDVESWRLRVAGLVEARRELTLDELRGFEPLHQFVTLLCISNPVGGDLTSTTRWTGVSLQRLLPELQLKPAATHLRIRAADGFHEVVALEEIRRDERVMLTYAWDGVPLPTEHGFPLRIYIPDRFGMKQPKWITAIEALDHWEPGYWVERGWDREARMKATSVIDTVVEAERASDAGTLVSVGGIAHAGARGVSKVELRVDRGEWITAQLREPLSGTTWIIWRADVPVPSGVHTFTVRCFESGGAAQIAEPSKPLPSGATGLHTQTTTI